MPFTIEDWIAVGVASLVGGIVVGLIARFKLLGVREIFAAKLEAEEKRSLDFEIQLEDRDAELGDLRELSMELQVREAELSAKLDAEFRSSEAKEALIERSQEQLNYDEGATGEGGARVRQEKGICG